MSWTAWDWKTQSEEKKDQEALVFFPIYVSESQFPYIPRTYVSVHA